ANTAFVETDSSNNLAVTASATTVTAPPVSGPVIIANGQSGYSDTGSWTTQSDPGDYGGTDRYASASGNGNNSATWQVSGLSAGQYTVQAAWPAFTGNASNAPFGIYDSATLLQTV